MSPLLFLLLSANAADLTYQGRALDGTGTPIQSESATIDITLLDQTGSEVTSVPFTNVFIDDGYFAVVVSVPDADLARATDVAVSVLGVDLGTQPISTVPRAASVGVPQNVQLQSVSGVRMWADGTHARSCEAYRRPPGGYAYSGATGDGLYRIDPDGSDPNSIPAYDQKCLMSEHGGGWTRVVDIRDGISTGPLSGVANHVERVNLGDWNFSLDLLRDSNREVLFRESAAPTRTHRYRMDMFCNVDDYTFIGLLTGDLSSSCVGVYDWTTQTYVSHHASTSSTYTGGRCNLNNHTQWNCTPANGVRFHIGTRDYNSDGGSNAPGTGSAWDWFTGYDDGYGDNSKLVLNWNGAYDNTPHEMYVR